MNPPPGNTIRDDELYTLREAERRLHIGRRGMQRAQKLGLRCVQFGRQKYVTGKAILAFFNRLEGRQADGEGRRGAKIDHPDSEPASAVQVYAHGDN